MHRWKDGRRSPRGRTRRTVSALSSLAVALGLLIGTPVVAQASPAGDVDQVGGAVVTAGGGLAPMQNGPMNVSHDRAVSAVPAAWTPQVLNGAVYDIAQVGNTVIVGGSFSTIAPSGGSPTLSRANVFAFNATTGAINTNFAPSVNGAVRAVEPGPTPSTVYIGGNFQGVNGVTGRVFLLDVNNGTVISSFTAPTMNGVVQDLERLSDRLVVGGYFSHVGGVEHRGLVSLDANTGARQSFIGVQLTQNHNYTGQPGQAQAGVGARSLAITPDGTQMAVVGNFRNANGLERRQMVLIDLAGTEAQVREDWRTTRYAPSCFSWAFDTYMRDVDVSPDGSYFTVATTGGPNPGTLCDTLTRWDVADSGQAVEPTWIDDTGGDTLLSVASSGAAIYTGGHQRWHNNHGGQDSPAPGSVGRAGLAAVDGNNGIPLAWNPGRSPRGVGAEAMYVTEAGLWLGSDTEQIGHWQYHRPRLAFFPVAGGLAQGPGDTGSLPANVYVASDIAPDSTGLSRVWYEGAHAAASPEAAPDGDLDWEEVRGAVVIDGELFYGVSDGTFWRRDFDGTTYGTATEIDPYNDPHWSNINTGSGGYTYQGLRPNFYNQISSLTGMAYADGRLYYTRQGANRLYSRSFLPESGILTQAVQEVQGFMPSNLGGVFFDPAGDFVYYSNTANGSLSRIGWSDGSVHGAATVVSGPGIDGMDWRGRAMFLADGPAPPENEPPEPVIDADCFRMECVFDASDSSDPDGEIVSYAWDLGDGTTSEEVEVSHTYATEGEYTVTLTVTDDRGAVVSTALTVEAFENRPPVAVAGDPVCIGLECTFDGSESFDPDDGDSIVAFEWDFGDDTVPSSGESVSHEFAQPGTYTVTLTVTDSEGATGTDSVDVQTREPGQPPELVGHAGVSAHLLAPQVQVPDEVEVGDLLLLFVSRGDPPEVEGPSGVTGWEEVSEIVSGSMVVSVFAKIADGSESGENVGVTLPQLFKTDLVVAAFRGVSEDPIEAVESAVAAVTASHTTPEVQVPGEGRTVLSFWAERSSVTTEWAAPDGVSVVSSQTGVGGGRVGSLLAYAQPEAGSYGGLVAQTNGTSGRSAAFTLVLSPDDGGGDDNGGGEDPPVNEPPIAVVNDPVCAGLECTFDGSESFDPDEGDSIVAFEWDLGDGSPPGSGDSVTHAYAGQGVYTVTLTVTDQHGASATDAVTVEVEDEAEPTETPELVGHAAVSGQAFSPHVSVPDGVASGDLLLLFVTASDPDDLSAPSGVGEWDEVNQVTSGPMVVRVFSRIADGSESGEDVAIELPRLFKTDVVLAAYRGVANEPFVSESTVAAQTSIHSTPVVDIAGEGRIALSFWAERSSATTEWSAPTEVSVISAQTGVGGGRVGSLLAEAQPGSGSYGNLVAETDATSARSAALTIVLTPEQTG